ncbi:ORF1 [Barthadenovirus mellis]|uniref:ORF1 n=1 Tax=Passerine adenovirus 1 TaxID=2779174 RepID=A0A7L9DHX1_9ADEN|nr:ORF1 [Passerine adenovirus 1]
MSHGDESPPSEFGCKIGLFNEGDEKIFSFSIDFIIYF